jgi:hypothetical protein
MCFVFSLIPATTLVVLGYFVLFSSTKTQGAVEAFGYVLAIWLFIIAAFFPTTGAYVTLTGLCPSIETMMKIMHSRVTGISNYCLPGDVARSDVIARRNMSRQPSEIAVDGRTQ